MRQRETAPKGKPCQSGGPYTVRFDGDIDLDREKTRKQLGFRDQGKEPPKTAQEPQKKMSMKERMAAAQAEADRRNSSRTQNQHQQEKTAERGK